MPDRCFAVLSIGREPHPTDEHKFRGDTIVANFQLNSDRSSSTDRLISGTLNEINAQGGGKLNISSITMGWSFICTSSMHEEFDVLITSIVRSC